MFEPQKYWEDRFNQNPNLNTTGYLGMGSTYNHWLYKAYELGLKRLLKKNGLTLTPQTHVIDAGAGSGFLEIFCRIQGVKNVQAFDFTTSSIVHLRKTFPEYIFSQWDLTLELQMDISPADITFCISVLYHIVSEKGFETALQNLSRMTKSSGYLVIADNFMPQEPNHPPDSHQRHWSKERYEQILRSLGFEIIEYLPIFFFLNSPIRYQNTSWGNQYLKFWTYVQKKIAGSPVREKIFSPIAFGMDQIFQRLFSIGPGSHYLLAKKK